MLKSTPAACALLTLGLLLAACGVTTPAATASPPAGPTTSGADPSSPAAPASPGPPATGSLPGVVADCTSAPPYQLSIRPASIVLACGDGGLGVENITWTTWTTSPAAGQGTFWEKLCQPNCADGKIGTYPVAVRLSAAQTSAQGPWFSRLSVTWQATVPPNPTPRTYELLPPGNR
jgi:hypothetical protein